MHPEFIRTGEKRLLTLAWFLDELPADVFDITSWFDAGKSRAFGDGLNVDGKTLKPVNDILTARASVKAGVTPAQMHACGTTACAMGWAATIPSFRRAGLTVKTGGISGNVEYNGFDGTLAAVDFFKISRSDAYNLFLPGGYHNGSQATPKDVARKIRAVVENIKAYA